MYSVITQKKPNFITAFYDLTVLPSDHLMRTKSSHRRDVCPH